MRRKGAMVVAALGLLAGGLWPAAQAMAVAGPGFAVSPAFGQITVAQNQPQVTYDVELTNHNTQDQAFALSLVDFGSLDENGGVAFLGTPTSELQHKYGLASWMTLPESSLVVPAGKTVTVPVVIQNRESLAPGGHYGALLATALTAGSGGGDSVGVKQVLSSLLLVTKEGGLKQELSVVSQTPQAGWWNLPTELTQRYHNTGNVHLVPRGVVSVKDPFGREVVRGAINEDSKVILPDTFRNYTTELIAVAQAWWPGRYRIITSYRFDGTDQVKIYERDTVYAGSVIAWILILLVVSAAAGLVWWLWGRPRGWFAGGRRS